MWKLAFAALAASTAIGTAAAQSPAAPHRPAVSISLSPQVASEVFAETVADICVAAIEQGRRVNALPNAKIDTLNRSLDPKIRQQSGASDKETVWEVKSARGVVLIRERENRCAVSVYGPPANPTLMAAVQTIVSSGSGFQRMVTPAGKGPTQSLRRPAKGGKPAIQVMVSGSDPGMPGHKSRFSVVTATVFEMKPRQ